MKKIIIIIAGLIACFSAVAGYGEEKAAEIYISQPDEIMIYESGFAIVKDIAKIDAQDIVQIELPMETILRTLVILDGEKRVKSFNSSNVDNFSPPPIMYEKTAKSPTCETQKMPITASAHTSQKNIVSWKTDTKGQREITLEYSVSGIGWSPIYNLNLSNKEDAAIAYSALITNIVMPLKEVKIDLTADGNKQRQDNSCHDRRLPPEVAAIYDITLDMPICQTPSPCINAGCKYEVGRRNLDIGTTSIEILSADLKYRKEFIWVTLFRQMVDVHYEIKNTTTQTLANGEADVYQNGTYIGKDNIFLTSPGELAHITFSGTGAIKVGKDINLTIVEDRIQSRNRHEVSLNIENVSNEEANIKIFDMKYPYTSDIEYSAKPTRESGNMVIWEITLSSMGKKSILYDFYSDSRYVNPYDASY